MHHLPNFQLAWYRDYPVTYKELIPSGDYRHIRTPFQLISFLMDVQIQDPLSDSHSIDTSPAEWMEKNQPMGSKAEYEHCWS